MSDRRPPNTPPPALTPESELDVLAAIYSFVIERHDYKKVADPTGDQNEVKEVRDVDPKRRLPHYSVSRNE